MKAVYLVCEVLVPAQLG